MENISVGQTQPTCGPTTKTMNHQIQQFYSCFNENYLWRYWQKLPKLDHVRTNYL